MSKGIENVGDIHWCTLLQPSGLEIFLYQDSSKSTEALPYYRKIVEKKDYITTLYLLHITVSCNRCRQALSFFFTIFPQYSSRLVFHNCLFVYFVQVANSLQVVNFCKSFSLVSVFSFHCLAANSLQCTAYVYSLSLWRCICQVLMRNLRPVNELDGQLSNQKFGWLTRRS